MKTFKDLEFVKHPNYGTGWGFRSQATLDFDNGYGVSVITGGYGTSSNPYEVAVMKEGSICYDTHITDDVIGYNDEDMVTDIMKKVQELEPLEIDINPNSYEAQ